MKDQMCQEIELASSCSSYIDLTNELSKICNLELYIQDKFMPISNLFLNSHIKKTLSKIWQ